MSDDDLDLDLDLEALVEHGSDRERFVFLVQVMTMLLEKLEALEERVRELKASVDDDWD